MATANAAPVRNALTVDLEDWYHICDAEEYLPCARWDDYEPRIEATTRRVLDLLARHGHRATFFVLGYIARRHPGLVRRIRAEGHEIATHGYFHLRATDVTREELRRDLAWSIEAIEDAVGERPIGYRAPEWTIVPETFWVYEELAAQGIRYSSSTVPLTGMGHRKLPRDPWRAKTKAGPVDEFPVTSMRLFWEALPMTGGLPLRIVPYWYVESHIRWINAGGRPAIVYLHPWELDPEIPVVPLPFGRWLMHYWNLRATRRKIEALLDALPFAPVGEVLYGERD